MKRFNPSVIVKLLALTVTLLLAYGAKAETRFLPDYPTSPITADKVALSGGKHIWECQQVKRGPSVNPVTVPGSKKSYFETVPEGVENPFERMEKAEKTVRCVEKEANNLNGRLKTVK